jgi:hypothetical protein
MPRLPARRIALFLPPMVAAALIAAAPSRGADVTGAMPTVVAQPGATVDLPITISPSLAGLNVFAIELRVPLDPANIASASWQPTGVVQAWGTPYTNVTSTFAALATAGTTPVTSTSTDLATLRVTVSASAVIGTDVPLTLSIFRLNAGTPSTAVLDGLLRIRAGADVPLEGGAGLALLGPTPSPVLGNARLSFALPATGRDGRGARLAIYDVRGRLVRTLARGVSGAGLHVVTWDAADSDGRRVAPGLYFAALDWNGRLLTRRVPVVR